LAYRLIYAKKQGYISEKDIRKIVRKNLGVSGSGKVKARSRKRRRKSSPRRRVPIIGF